MTDSSVETQAPAEPCVVCGHKPGADPTQIDQEAAACVRSADHRAAALTATGTLAASLALSGAAIVVDTSNSLGSGWGRTWFESALIAALALFTLSALAALTGHWRKGGKGTAIGIRTLFCREPKPNVSIRLRVSPQHLNWQLAQVKHAHVTVALFLLFGGMLAVIVMVVVSTLVAS